MKREERLKIAKRIARKVLKKYGNKVLAIGVYGSVARGEDRRYSDLDMIVIVKKKREGIYDRFFIYKGLPVLVEFETIEEVKKRIRNMWFKWPLEVNAFLSILPLFDPQHVFTKFKREYERLSEKDFREGAMNALEHVYEYFLTVKNAYVYKEREKLLLQARVFARSVACFLALINHTYFKSGKKVFEQKFKKYPKNYYKLIKIAAGFISLNEKKVYEVCKKLFKETMKFAGEMGLKIDDSKIKV